MKNQEITRMKKNKAIAYDNLSSTAAYLEKMAREGWMLEQVLGNSSFTFVKCEPKDLRFAVEVFGESSIFDTTPTEQNLEYVEFCKKAGWNFICANGKFNFFYTEDKNAPEIETDQEMKLKVIAKAMRPMNIIYPIFLLFMSTYFFFMMGVLNLNLTEASVFQFSGLPLWITVTLLYGINLIRHLLWLGKAKKAVKNGDKIPENKHFSNYWTYILILVAVGLLHSGISVWAAIRFQETTLYIIPCIWIIVLSIAILTRKFNIYMEKHKVERSNYKLMTFVVLPVCTEIIIFAIIIGYVLFSGDHGSDMIVMSPADKIVFDQDGKLEEHNTKWGHFLLNYDTYTLSAPDADFGETVDNDAFHLRINIYSTQIEHIYNRLLNDAKNGNKLRMHGILFPFDNASEAVSSDSNVTIWAAEKDNDFFYLICDGTNILDTRCSQALNSEQIAILEKTFMTQMP